MSEKRFTYFKNPVGFGKQGIQDSENYQVFDFTMSNVLDLLNELADENEQLRQQLQEYKENWDNLVEKASEIAKRNVVLDEQIGQLQRENEQLRQRIAFFEKQEDEFEQYTAQTIQNMIANYRDDE